jgi:hypothetical protein
MVKDEIGAEALQVNIKLQLSGRRHAIAHGLLASMRISEAVTTNFDDLYEMAAGAVFDNPRLSVLPWRRMPGRPPWLLKMHGDLVEGDLVFTSEDYRSFARQHRVLGAVVQGLLVTRHLLFVGYSLRDKNFLRLAGEVAVALRRSNAPHTRIGTVLDLSRRDQPDLPAGIDSIMVGDGDGLLTPTDTRLLEIFLDRMVWAATHREDSWVLDERYEKLLGSDEEREAARLLRTISLPGGERWERLGEILQSYGSASAD